MSGLRCNNAVKQALNRLAVNVPLSNDTLHSSVQLGEMDCSRIKKQHVILGNIYKYAVYCSIGWHTRRGLCLALSGESMLLAVKVPVRFHKT